MISKEIIEAKVDLIVGCDGSYSAVRQQLFKDRPIDFSQTYQSGYYLELHIPSINGKFAMAKNHLHIWPRGNFMVIALPNQDATFTVTLFMPYAMFENIKTNAQLLEFFEKNFPDALELIGRYLVNYN